MPPGINGADIAYMIPCTAMVFLMTIVLGPLYASLVQKKNALNCIMHSLFALGAGGLAWWAIDYSLAFGPDHWHVIGGLNWAFFHGVGAAPNTALAPTIPHGLFALYQMAFAVVTPALIAGAYAERMKYSATAVFTVLWMTLVYAPVAHMVWAPHGILRDLGALDFAGGGPVHMASGLAGLAVASVLGRRLHLINDRHAVRPPHNLKDTAVYAGILWFGWYGFNPGSALAANTVAVNAAITTTLATCAAMLAWLGTDMLFTSERKPTILGAASGILAGLVAITPACGFVGPSGGVAIGLIAGLVSGFVVNYVKERFNPIDDALDTVPVHFLAGAVGCLLVGIFATKSVNPAGANGLLAGGGFAQLGIQAVSVLVVIAVVLAGSYLALLITKPITRGLRVDPEIEAEGLDLGLHAQRIHDHDTELSPGRFAGRGADLPAHRHPAGHAVASAMTQVRPTAD